MSVLAEDLYFMNVALERAREALTVGEIPVGAVLVSNNRILGAAYNRRLVDKSPFAHAEMLAMEGASGLLQNWRFDHCSLYVTLEPCPMCAGAIVQTRISRVVYGASDPKAGAGGTLYNILCDPRLLHRCQVKSGVLAEESRALLREYFQNKRKCKGKTGQSEQFVL